MTRWRNLTFVLAGGLLTLVLLSAADAGRDAPGSASWGSSLTVRDPVPGFWRAQSGASTDSVRPYSVGWSSLVATTRLAVAPNDDLELTNMGPTGVLVLESGALVLTSVEGPVALQRGGAIAGLEPAPIGAGALLMRGDRITFHASATVTFRNAEATSASLLLATRMPDFSLPMEGNVQ
jgi:hypothetical protein